MPINALGIAARILLASNVLFPPRPRSYYATENDYYRARRKGCEVQAGYLTKMVDFNGKKVLGDKLLHYKELLPIRSAVGFDINERYIELARVNAAKMGFGEEVVRFECVDCARMPCEDASFDLILSEDMVEHVADVPSFLSECWRVLRPGGTMLLSGGPFGWSHWGSHLYYQFGLPWVGHLFSSRVIREASAALPRPRQGFMMSTPEQELDQFEQLNWITPHRLTRLIDENGFQRRVWAWEPAKLRFLFAIPLFNVLFMCRLTAILDKPGQNRAEQGVEIGKALP
ncbi:MAG: class I SAM-dependent methyltransferase [Nitrososphaera sp.]|nr:class I SAM-dependent methyltransferase [Nitrososphaera sp.]